MGASYVYSFGCTSEKGRKINTTDSLIKIIKMRAKKRAVQKDKLYTEDNEMMVEIDSSTSSLYHYDSRRTRKIKKTNTTSSKKNRKQWKKSLIYCMIKHA